MSTHTKTRWIGVERCPNGDAVHVVPLTISSSHPLVALETPGNITAAGPCPFCCPIPSASCPHCGTRFRSGDPCPTCGAFPPAEESELPKKGGS